TPTLAQKQNLGETRIRGIQLDAEYRLASMWRVSGGYLYDEAKVTDGGLINAALVGKYVPQVPLHRGSVQVSYANPKYLNASLNVLMTGLQYNDDQNVNFIPAATLSATGYDSTLGAGLPGYVTVDLLGSRDIGRNLQVFIGAQNIFDKMYF